MAIKINEPAHRVVAGRRKPGRRPRQNRSRSARHQWRDWSNGKGLLRVDATSRRHACKCTVKPASIGRTRTDETTLQHVLSVEMRPFAVRRRDRMDDCRLAGLVEAVQVRHGRIERKESIERQRSRCSVGRKCVVAAQALPIRIADRRNGSKTVKRAAKHNHQKPRVPTLSLRHPGKVRPGKQRSRSEQKFAAVRLMDHDITCVGIRETSEEGPRLAIGSPRGSKPLWFRLRAGR